MCGIVAYARPYSSSSALEGISVLDRMVDSLIHRGPDGRGAWIADRVALGHRRLAIIDLGGGSQPMHDETGRLSIVFNGEIYNYLELNRELAAKGLIARTRSDTETILHAYAAWGDDCVNHLNGMFAFVIYDAAGRRLFAARDRMGKKPFYYVHKDGFFALASEPRALLIHPAVVRKMDIQAASQFLMFEHVPAPLTIYQGMRKLPAGHRMAYDLQMGGLKIEEYWDLPMATGRRIEVPSNFDDAAALVRQTLMRCVERRLIADVPLGVFLSGGIDSSAVTAAMVQLMGAGRVKTFSIGFTDPTFDESSQARQLAQQLGTEHHEEILDTKAVADVLPRVADHMDEPLADPSILPTFLLSGFARQHVTVALGGDGGDEDFGGYATFKALGAADWYNRLVPGWLHQGVMSPMADRLPVGHAYMSWDFKIKQFLRGVKRPEDQRLWRWLGAMVPEQLAGLLTEDALRQLNLDRAYEQVEQMYARVSGADAVNRDCYLYSKTYLAEGVLTKVDRASMACSLETRSPLLDWEMVELAASLKGSLKVHGGILKHVFKRATADLLPRQTLTRRKQGFAPPIGQWFKTRLKDLLMDTLSPQRVRQSGYLRVEAVQRLIDEHMTNRRDHRKPLMALFMLEWFRSRWIDHA